MEITTQKTLSLSPQMRQNLIAMNGEEIEYNEEVVGIQYPFIIVSGEKKKLNASQWEDLNNQYWNSNRNEGSYLMKEVEAEFGGLLK